LQGTLTTEEVDRAVLEAARDRARAHLLSLQTPDGWWKGELQSNVTMDAEDLLLREFLGVRDQGKIERAATWIRSQQRGDGTWSNFEGGPPNLSTTVEAYAALRLAGDGPDAPHMARARAYILDAGGVEATRVFTHIWLALFGLWDWDEIPALPPELILLPSWFPLNPYDFACWARQTIVALTIVRASRPRRTLPFTLDELRTGRRPAPGRHRSLRSRALARLDRVLRIYERRPIKALRRRALARAERWIGERQEADGSWGGIQPPWVYSLIALSLRGYPLDHPVIRKGLEGIESFIVEEDGVRRLEACQSPVWDTALAMIALTDAGLRPDHPAVVRAGEWLLERQVNVRGDWSVRKPDVEPGGFPFEFCNDNYPDVDDTAEVVMALRRASHPDPARLERGIERAVRWLVGLQCRDGGFGAFDADNTRSLCREIVFCDFGEVIDGPSADVTAHAVEMLAVEGLGGRTETRRAVRWLTDAQEADGSWFGRWGVNYVYGTGSAVPALVAAGVDRWDSRIRRAVGWLEAHQNADGGFGEDPRSYDDPQWIGRGESTASQTAWALLALEAAGEAGGAAATRALRWLAETQRPDGGWDEPQYTGTGFPSDYYINYHLYRQVFPLMALGRCLSVEPPKLVGVPAPEPAAPRRAGRARLRTAFRSGNGVRVGGSRLEG
jgi:squalene-hopene/tetraprenyl-beta-curcumene cyclase